MKKKIVYMLLLAFVVAIFIRVFVAEGFVVRGDSMHPAVESGDYVFVNKLAYWRSEPQRGDIIVATTREGRVRVLKRVVGMPGERFDIKDGKIILRETRTDEGKVLQELYLTNPQVLTGGEIHTVLDPQEYFVLGDNREVSLDSRQLDYIDKWDIKGRVFGKFNLSKFSYKGL